MITTWGIMIIIIIIITLSCCLSLSFFCSCLSVKEIGTVQKRIIMKRNIIIRNSTKMNIKKRAIIKNIRLLCAYKDTRAEEK